MAVDEADWPFEHDIIEAVAGEHALEPDELVGHLRDHQEQMAALPGVENLVYEWRKQFDATVLARTPSAYYVAAPPWIWEEFATHLDADEAAMAAIETVHERTVHSLPAFEDGSLGDAAACILLRS